MHAFAGKREERADANTNSVAKDRLTGLGGSSGGGLLTSDRRREDLHGNVTTVTEITDRADKTVWRVTAYPDSTNNAVSVTVNGLQTASETKTGVAYSYAYDAIERRVGVTDPRTGTSATHYNAKGQVDYIEDPASNRTSYGYSSSTGRRIAVTNALGKATRYQYDDKGQLVRPPCTRPAPEPRLSVLKDPNADKRVANSCVIC